MNRHERRRAKKLSRDASIDEIFVGSHGPIPGDTATKMTAAIEVLLEGFPNCDVTLFVAEKEATEGRDLPRFNYISSAERPDMIAVLKAFVAKNEVEGPTLDKIKDEPQGSA